ncbi:MAG: LON peptidase substrate-binding domain-containing protein [Acidobacteriota bacterium]|nr:LON peptidase substrate-binding domain-containing protein [Acidobacteriota bacterium]
MSSSTIPIFPLPTVVLFPHVFLPLHIFEARYRQMVADALSGDRMIGMTLLKGVAGSESDEPPPVYAVGCSGVITHVERLADGRFNLVLRGLEKFRILGEQPPASGQLYRTAVIAPIDETVLEAERLGLAAERRRLEAQLAPLFDRAQAASLLPEAMPDVDLVNALAQYLEFDPVERQALLEQQGPLARCRAIMELLEVKALLERMSAREPGTVH